MNASRRRLELVVRVVLVVSIVSAHAHAQVSRPEADTPLTLGALYQELLSASPRLEAAQAFVRAAEARVPGARRPPDPQLQLGFMNRELPSFRPMELLGMTQLQLMQMIPVAGKLALAGRQAEAEVAAARSRALDVRWDLRAQTAMAFYDLYAADRSLDVAIATRRLLQDIASTAQTMYAVGDGRQSDVLRAQVEIARMTEDILRMQTMRTGMHGRLAGLLSKDPDPDPGSAAGRPALPKLPDELPSLDSLIRSAQANRPMIRAGQDAVRGAAAASALARREIWPDLEVGVQYAQQRDPMGSGTAHMGSLMIGATVPVFARSRQLRMRDEAAAMERMAEADLTAMRAETAGEVARVYADWRRAHNLVALYRETILPQARATVTSSYASYRVGEVDFMTLLDNQMAVNRYQQELIALEAEQGKALAELEMLIANELFDPDQVAAPATGSAR